MKKYKFNKLILILTLSFFTLTGCAGWIDSDLNINPDQPSDVPMRLMLPSIESSMGFHLVGNTTVRTNNIWMQLFDGVSRQSSTEGHFLLTGGDTSNVWGSIYTEILINLQIMIEKSKTEGSESPHFEGVGQVLQATTLGITTDLWGDIPFSEALKGTDNLKAAYDSQEMIYNTIFSTLDDAVANLNSTNNVFAIRGDVIYNGNLTKWKKAANSIKARHYLQLSNRLGNEAYTKALAAVAGGFTSNADDFMVPFDATDENPIYQFIDDRDDIRMASTLVDMLAANDDPRLPFYSGEDANGDYTGSIPGSDNADASRPGPYVNSQDSPGILMTYSELKFIEAEAQLGLGQTALAQAAYEAAVAASVLRVTGSANQAWLDANINGVAVTLENIITQKWIDGFGTNQPYADYRRTGFPVLSLPQGTLYQSAMPVRFPYAQSELNYNFENVPSVQLTDKVWWDQ